MSFSTLLKKRLKAISKRRSVTQADSFDVLVVATMSAGKSSLINALIGSELLPTANEATTACITSVKHQRSLIKFSGTSHSEAGYELDRQMEISENHVRVWNADAQVKHIRLTGKFRTAAPYSVPRLVLHDSPGPNNSRDVRHANLTMEAVRTIPYKVLLYVLNASQLGTKDDRALLEQLRKELALRPRHQLVFILNKVDLIDPERGEDISACVRNTQTYLKAIGFDCPIIVPTMTDAALCASKVLNAEPLTRAQRLNLRHAIDGLKNHKRVMLRAAIVPDAIRRSVAKNWQQLEMNSHASVNDAQASETLELQQLIAYSGIRTVETLIKSQCRKIART